MAPVPMPHAGGVESPSTPLRRLLGGMSIFTLVMSIPQILAIWVQHQAAGVSVVSWSAYLLSALLWFWYGLRSCRMRTGRRHRQGRKEKNASSQHRHHP